MAAESPLESLTKLLDTLLSRSNATPLPDQQFACGQVFARFESLSADDRITVMKMAALLRVADALDRSDRQRIDDIRCTRMKDRFAISVSGMEEVSLEQLALQQKGSLFAEVFGMPIMLRKVVSH